MAQHDIVKLIEGADITDVIELCQEYRRKADGAEREHLTLLVLVEEHADWRGQTSDGTFANFLKHWHLGAPERYARFKQVTESLDEEVIAKIGVAASMQLMRISDEDEREQALREVCDTAEEHGVPLSDQTARDRIRPHLPPSLPLASRRAQKIDQLEEENRRLKAEVRALKKENRELRAQVEKRERSGSGRGQTGGRKGGARKPGRKRTQPRAS